MDSSWAGIGYTDSADGYDDWYSGGSSAADGSNGSGYYITAGGDYEDCDASESGIMGMYGGECSAVRGTEEGDSVWPVPKAYGDSAGIDVSGNVVGSMRDDAGSVDGT